MKCLYYHDCDKYDKHNEDEVVNKDRRNEIGENSDEIGVDGNNDKNEDYGNSDNRKIFPGSCMITGMIVDVLVNMAMTENHRKPTGNYAPKYSENINTPKDEEDTNDYGTIKRNLQSTSDRLYLSRSQ